MNINEKNLSLLTKQIYGQLEEQFHKECHNDTVEAINFIKNNSNNISEKINILSDVLLLLKLKFDEINGITQRRPPKFSSKQFQDNNNNDIEAVEKITEELNNNNTNILNVSKTINSTKTLLFEHKFDNIDYDHYFTDYHEDKSLSVSQNSLDEIIELFVSKIKNNGLVQGTEEWKKVRASFIGGSELHDVLGDKKEPILNFIKKKVGLSPSHNSCNIYTLWGNLFEEVIMQYTEYLFDTKVKGDEIFIYDHDKPVSYSPDGISIIYHYGNINNTNKKIINGKRTEQQKIYSIALMEYKCPFTRVLDGKIKPQYLTQVMLGLLEVPIVNYAIFAEGIFKSCSVSQWIYNNKINNKVHKINCSYKCKMDEKYPITEEIVNKYIDDPKHNKLDDLLSKHKSDCPLHMNIYKNKKPLAMGLIIFYSKYKIPYKYEQFKYYNNGNGNGQNQQASKPKYFARKVAYDDVEYADENTVIESVNNNVVKSLSKVEPKANLKIIKETISKKSVEECSHDSDQYFKANQFILNDEDTYNEAKKGDYSYDINAIMDFGSIETDELEHHLRRFKEEKLYQVHYAPMFVDNSIVRQKSENNILNLDIESCFNSACMDIFEKSDNKSPTYIYGVLPWKLFELDTQIVNRDPEFLSPHMDKLIAISDVIRRCNKETTIAKKEKLLNSFFNITTIRSNSSMNEYDC